MNYPISYFQLLNIFEEKRDNLQGGVEGFFTPFSISPMEWQGVGVTKNRLMEMLNFMKGDKVRIPDQNGEKYLINVIKGYENAGSNVVIFDCCTKAIKEYKKMIKSNVKCSLIKIDKSRKIAKWGSNEADLYDSGFRALFTLHANFPQVVSYSEIWDYVYSENIETLPSIEQRKKAVYDLVDGVRRRLRGVGFPKDFIVVSRGEGYKLNI